MTLRFDFFYENADKEYFLALLQKLANACGVDLRAESSAEFLSVFASAESGEILGKFADFLQVEVPHSLYFKLKEVSLCNEARGEKIALIARSDIFSVSDINVIKDIQSPRFCEIYADSANNKNPSLRADSQNLRGKPPIEKGVELQNGLPRSHSLARNDEILDSSVASLPHNDKNKDFAESNTDSTLLKSTLQNLCDDLTSGRSVALGTSRGEILLSTNSADFDFILANDIATLNLYARASQDEISALASFEKPLIELAIKEVFVREVGAKSAKFILPYDIILCCFSSMLLERDIAFVRAKFAESSAESSAKIAESTLKSSAFFEIVVGQNGYFLHKNYMDCADFAEFLNINFGTESSADSANIMIYLSPQNPSIFACAGRKIANIAFDKNPKNILQKISHLENGDKLIANFKKAFEVRYEAIQKLDSAPQWTQNLLDIFECAAMILGCEADKNVIFDLAKSYLRDIGPKIDFKNIKLNSSLRADSQNLCGKPLCKKTQDLQGGWLLRDARKSYGLPRAINCARNDENLDSSLRKCSAQNDKMEIQNDNLKKTAESSADSATRAKTAESANKTQQTIEEIAVEVAEFLADFGRKAGLESAQCPKSAKSLQDAPKTKLQTNDLIYDELKTIRSIISFTLAGTEREVVAFGILESLADYLVLLFREAQNQFGAKNIAIAGDLFANKVFFDKITKKIPTNFKLIFPKYLDISSARRASCKT